MKKLSVVPLLALLVALVVTGVTLVHPAEQAQAVARAVALAPAVTGVETALGVQIPGRTGSVRSEQSAQGVLADGRYLACFVNSGGPGTPARFFAMDLTGATVAQLAVPVGTDILTVVYSPATRTVLFAANTATASFLYEWDGVTLRQVATIPGQAVMRLAATPDGPVYVGTFAPSDGRLYVYARGVLTDLGQPIAGESYVRSLVADTTSVWVSNYREAGAKLVRVDRATRARTVIAVPAALAGQWSALDMSRAGPYLFLRTVNDPRLFAYDTVAGAFRGFDDQVARVSTAPEVPNPRSYIDGISPYGVSPLLEGRYVYFQRSGAGLMRVDVAAGFKTVRVDRWNAGDNVHPWPASSVPGPVSYAWLSGVGGRAGPSLVTTTIDGRVYVNTPAQTGPLVWSLAAREAPSTIIRVGADPTGTVFTGGFDLPAGVGAYSPASGTTTVLQGPQVEGFGSFGSSTVMGGYTGNSAAAGPLYLYSGTGQPVLRTYLGNGQERPVALAQVGSTVAVGSVPIKNTLGGALSIWDPVSNALTVRAQPHPRPQHHLARGLRPARRRRLVQRRWHRVDPDRDQRPGLHLRPGQRRPQDLHPAAGGHGDLLVGRCHHPRPGCARPVLGAVDRLPHRLPGRRRRQHHPDAQPRGLRQHLVADGQGAGDRHRRRHPLRDRRPGRGGRQPRHG